MSKHQTKAEGKSSPLPVTLTLGEAHQVAGGGATVTADQVWDALAEANADAKRRTKAHYIA